MSVILRKRKNSDGSITLRMDIYRDGKRVVETLKHLKLDRPSTVLDRENNKRKLQQATEIVVARAAELEASNYSLISDSGKKTIITDWMQSYVNDYKKKDKRNMQGALNRFQDFLVSERKSGLTFGHLNALLIEDFIEYLESKSTGEGASSYYNRFKKMIKLAHRKKLLKENILDSVDKKVKGRSRKKDILTLEELKILSATTTENGEVKRAFLFTCLTGLRWCDIKILKWNSIDLKTKQMNIRQSKTGEDVATPLNDTAIKLLGTPLKENTEVFTLPSANGANKTLKAWVKRAGITKAITWHNGRHSFGTNLIYNEVDILTASKLLGHMSMKHTQRYVDSAREMKEVATNKLNFEL